MRLMFEITNLWHVTPGSVSRNGCVTISEQVDHKWSALANSCIEKTALDGKIKVTLKSLLNKYVPESLDYLRKNFEVVQS